MIRCLHPLLSPLSEIYKCRRMVWKLATGEEKKRKEIWCLHVALVTGIPSLLMRACPPRKPGFNFPFEMGTGPHCQFIFHWSAVCPPRPFLLGKPLTVPSATMFPWSNFWFGLGWMALLLLLPAHPKRTTLAMMVGLGGESPQEIWMWWNSVLPSEVFCDLMDASHSWMCC